MIFKNIPNLVSVGLVNPVACGLFVDAYCDGASSPRSDHQATGSGGVGLLIDDENDESVVFGFSSFEGTGTNQTAELNAAGNVIALLAGAQLTANITTDSEYTIGCLEVLRTGGYAYRKIKKNTELVMRIREQQSRILGHVNYSWVRGHNSHVCNELADELAVTAKVTMTTLVSVSRVSGVLSIHDAASIVRSVLITNRKDI